MRIRMNLLYVISDDLYRRNYGRRKPPKLDSDAQVNLELQSRSDMDEEDQHVHAPPPLVSLAPFSPIPLPSRRRLSTCFVPPLSSPAPLAWLSLQGRLLNAEEATSIRSIGADFSSDQALAWHLFTPIQRFLIVAVIGVAVAESRKNYQICQLKKSVQLRDEVLSSMQQKLDNLCEQLKEHSIAATNKSFTKNGESELSETCGFACKCWLCDQHSDLFNALMGSSVTRLSCGNEVLHKMPLSNEQQEERRMSDLSDWASSVTSAADIQLSSLGLEQDLYNLKRDCEEKDTTIKELTTLLNSSEVAKSKRVAELEDIIRRKNTTITKLKKDLVVLEQKVMQLSRLGRPSSGRDSYGDQVAHVRDNLLYNMDTSTSPSSSDSDTTPLNRVQDSAVKVGVVHILNRASASASSHKSAPVKPISSSGKPLEPHLKSPSLSPLQEISANRKCNAASSSSRPNQLSAREDLKKSRRRYLSGTKNTASHKKIIL
ncbi:inactive rhomboid protein [Senna tora]|uniref:Inactive rhomboid protein n=1 Tax=Senna tora TaxID=362788 RepID=A0A834W4G7_9FABA|nr:inactive rhomboid protein [Senna tora]